MSLTEEQIEQVSDRLKQFGFDTSDLDNDQIAILVEVILESFGFYVE